MVIEGVSYPADFQVGALTSEVGPLTLLGLAQFHHAIIEEVTDSLDDAGETSADGGDGEPEAGESVTPNEGGSEGGESADGSADGEPEVVPPTPPAPPTPPVPDATDAVAVFMAAGLDKATAEALAITNRINSLEELNTLLADKDFDLLDLDEIGAVRAEKIKAIFLPAAS